MKEKESIVGRRFGRLVVKERVDNDSTGHIRYKVICDCGTEKIVRKDSLLDSSIRSCGCLQKDVTSKRCTVHGYSDERLYKVWAGMKQRCNNPNHVAYNNYGGRGISVCKEWEEDYTKFREFMLSHGYDPEAPFGECTIDRINNDGNYCPENCRVISVQEQQNGKRDIFSFILDGKRTTVTGAARMKGKTRSCVQYRMAHGWSLEDAIETPLREIRKYEANGEFHTVKEWAEILKVTKNVIEGRLQTHTMQEIVDEWNEKGFIQVRVAPKLYYEVNGVSKCRAQWAKEMGLPENTLRCRLKKKTMQEIYEDWEANGRKYIPLVLKEKKYEEANGERLCRSHWCKKLHIGERTLRKLLKEYTMQEIYDMYKDRIC